MPEGRSPQVLLAEGLVRQGQLLPANEAVHAALAAEPSTPHVHCLLAELMLSADFYDEAIAAATQAIELDPDCAPAYLALGLAYDRRGGMWDQSVLVWHELAEVVPDLVVAHVQLGESFDDAGFEEEAIDAWRKALELDPRHPRAMYDLAVAALKREGMATALPGFRKAGELDPSQDALFFALAGGAGTAGALGAAGATSAGDAGVALDERAARLHQGALLAAHEDWFAATDAARELLDADPDDAEALALAAFAYLKQEAGNEATACAARALTLRPDLPTALLVLGVSSARRPGLARHAARAFAALARVAPDYPMPYVLLAESLLGLQKYRKAKEAYLRAVSLDPACVRARFGLAAAYLTEGRRAHAQWEMRRAAYHDTRRTDTFWRLYDAYAAGEGA